MQRKKKNVNYMQEKLLIEIESNITQILTLT